MEALTSQDLQLVSSAIGSIYSLRTLAEFPGEIMLVLENLISSE